MNESELKRALVRSILAQDGEAFRVEDRYRLGVPDMLMLPAGFPGFLVEAKILRGARLTCTPAQKAFLARFHKPPLFLTALIGYSEKNGALYIGRDGDGIALCRYIQRPVRLDSNEWAITELLSKWYHDEARREKIRPLFGSIPKEGVRRRKLTLHK